MSCLQEERPCVFYGEMDLFGALFPSQSLIKGNVENKCKA